MVGVVWCGVAWCGVVWRGWAGARIGFCLLRHPEDVCGWRVVWLRLGAVVSGWISRLPLPPAQVGDETENPTRIRDDRLFCCESYARVASNQSDERPIEA